MDTVLDRELEEQVRMGVGDGRVPKRGRRCALTLRPVVFVPFEIGG